MQIPKLVIDHSLEIDEATLLECGHQSTRVGKHLQACGWTMGEAAWRASVRPTPVAGLGTPAPKRTDPYK